MTRRRASLAATSAPCARRTRCRHKSTPPTTPADVRHGPVGGKQDVTVHVGVGERLRRARRAGASVVAARRSSSPAAARVKAPEHSAAAHIPWCAARKASVAWAGTRAYGSARPGTTMRSQESRRSRSWVAARWPTGTSGCSSTPGAQIRSSEGTDPRVSAVDAPTPRRPPRRRTSGSRAVTEGRRCAWQKVSHGDHFCHYRVRPSSRNTHTP